MVILSAAGIEKAFGERRLLRGLSFAINKGDKIALIGANGAGKTTLFRIISGEDADFRGELYLSRQSRVDMMRQHAEFSGEKTALAEVMECFSQLEADEKRLAQLEAALGEDEQAIKRYTELQERFIENGGLTFRARAKSTLIGLGLSEEEIGLPLAAISGGQRTRALLAKLLLGEADILLLDEPTNHLDLEATAWLEDFLISCKKTVIVISHDRYFLDRVAGRTFLLAGGELRCYSGGYTASLRQRTADEEAQRNAREQKLREISRLEGIIAQQKQWNRERNLVTARSKQKAIDRIAADLEDVPFEEREIGFHFAPTEECANEVLTLSGIKKSFDANTLIENADLTIFKGQSVFLLGPNGSGKTTLLRMILGQLAPDEGTVRLGRRVTVGYYEQALSRLDPEKTVVDVVYDAMPHLSLGEIRSALALFLFRGEDVYKKTGLLSGGEKARVCLCALMLGGYNLLLLDEPTNHLDIASREALESALASYGGTILAVSHDRYFISKLADMILELKDAKITAFPFGYEQYVLNKAAPPAEEEKKPPRPVSDYAKKREERSALNRLRGSVRRLEEQIAETDKKKAEVAAQMEASASDYQEVLRLSQRAQELDDEEAALYGEWEECAAALERAEETSGR